MLDRPAAVTIAANLQHCCSSGVSQVGQESACSADHSTSQRCCRGQPSLHRLQHTSCWRPHAAVHVTMEPHDSVQVQPLLWSKNQGRGVQTCSLDGWQSSPAWRSVMAKHSLWSCRAPCSASRSGSPAAAAAGGRPKCQGVSQLVLPPTTLLTKPPHQGLQPPQLYPPASATPSPKAS